MKKQRKTNENIKNFSNKEMKLPKYQKVAKEGNILQKNGKKESYKSKVNKLK